MSLIEALRRGEKEAFGQLDTMEPSLITSNLSELIEIALKQQDRMNSFNLLRKIHEVLQSDPVSLEENFERIVDLIKRIVDMDLPEDDLLNSSGTMFLTLILPKFMADPSIVDRYAGFLLHLMAVGGTYGQLSASPISQVAQNRPQVIAPYVKELFSAIKTGNDTLLVALYGLYPYNKEGFEEEFETLMELYKLKPAHKSIILKVIGDIATSRPEMIKPHLGTFLPDLSGMGTSYLVLNIFTEVAKADPHAVEPFIDRIYAEVDNQPHMAYSVPNLLGLIGRALRTEDMLEKLVVLMRKVPEEALPMVLAEIRNLGEMDTSLLDPYITEIKKLENHQQEGVRDQARMVVDLYEGRSLRTLELSIEEQNRRISEAVQSTEDLRRYVDENVSELKDFIAQINKKLPIPKRFSTRGKIRKTLILEFVCDGGSPNCLFPDERPFTTETKDWNKWLKIAFSGIKLGKSLIVPASAGDAISAVKDAYDAYKEKYDKDFLSYIKEPFLTSAEQDNLVNQLRDSKFFNVFSYDAQTANWVCTMCSL
ncbi:MAG: hypothetical protein D6732_16280 [Methanobacteriota archaeon]|nr:MAG: hypothetical protein D6732_16280 [Euryarchaeota archaeon]